MGGVKIRNAHSLAITIAKPAIHTSIVLPLCHKYQVQIMLYIYRAKCDTQLAKMSFDETLDLTADV